MTRSTANLRLSIVTAASAVALAVPLVARDARAQSRGWTLDRYEPNPAGDVFFASDFPWYNSTRLLALGVISDYTHNALVIYQPGTDAMGHRTSTPVRNVVENMEVLHVQGSIALFDRIGINFSLPISLDQSGQAATAATLPQLNAYQAPVTGDMRFGLRLRIANQSDTDPISAHVGGYVIIGGLPYNDRPYNVTDNAIQARGFATLAGHPGPFRWSLTIGYHYRPSYQAVPGPMGSATVSHAVFVNAAIALASADGRVTVGPEIWASYTLDGAAQSSFSERVSAELLMGIHYLLGDTILIGAGAGPGISQGTGTPEMRALFRLAYAPQSRPAAPVAPPPPPDRDHDGVPDTSDECPNEPAGPNPDALRLGCPLHDVDNDGIPDDEDRCPNEPAGPHPDSMRRGCPEPDTDHDGVLDHADQCVTTPAGEHPDPDRPGCPDGDDDNDGVLNHDDLCPTVHRGFHPDPARAGCPLPDRDNDSVPDAMDHCPDQPGAPSPDPNRNGCPGLVRVEAGQVRILQQVFFATNGDRILPRSFPLLQAVADALRASPEIRRVAVEGHSDNVGNAAHNMDLSQRRANSVMAWLGEHSIEAARLEAHGYGSTRPIADNHRSAGRAQNRRVEFHIIDPAPPSSAAPASNAPSSAPAASAAPSSAAPASTVPSGAPLPIAPSSTYPAPASASPSSPSGGVLLLE